MRKSKFINGKQDGIKNRLSKWNNGEISDKSESYNETIEYTEKHEYTITKITTNQNRPQSNPENNKPKSSLLKKTKRVILFIVCTFILKFKTDTKVFPLKNITFIVEDIIIAFGFGNTIIINKRTNIEKEANNKVRKLPMANNSASKLDQLVYNSESDDISVNYTTIQAPSGVNLDFALPDKTKVRLKPGSIIKFPNIFNDNERKIELDGEADFDITPDKQRPFRVFKEKHEIASPLHHLNTLS